MKTQRMSYAHPNAPTIYEDLRDYIIIGNHHSDSAFLNLAIRFIKDDGKPIEQRANIVRRYDEAIGFKSRDHDDKTLINNFLKDMKD